MEITKKLIKFNFNKGGNSKKYITIHDTGNYGEDAGAINHFKYFNGADRQSSAHYFVEDKIIVQCVEDNDISWHNGVKYGQNAPRKEINNYNSIGIEICVNPKSNYNVAVKNTVELVKMLMKKYNIPAENVVRHYDSCLKTCPSSMSKNDWALWKDFKKKIVENNIKGDDDEMVTTVDIIIDGKKIKANRIFKDGKNYIELRTFAQAGYKIGYDEKTKTPTIDK